MSALLASLAPAVKRTGFVFVGAWRARMIDAVGEHVVGHAGQVRTTVRMATATGWLLAGAALVRVGEAMEGR